MWHWQVSAVFVVISIRNAFKSFLLCDQVGGWFEWKRVPRVIIRVIKYPQCSVLRKQIGIRFPLQRQFREFCLAHHRAKLYLNHHIFWRHKKVSGFFFLIRYFARCSRLSHRSQSLCITGIFKYLFKLLCLHTTSAKLISFYFICFF